MGIGIKTRHFSLSDEKQNGTWEKDGLGWNPAYAAKSEGSGINTSSFKYEKNHARMQGICAKCSKFNGSKKSAVSHCDLPVNERCEK